MPAHLTHLIHRMQSGDRAAASELFEHCKPHFSRMSRQLLQRESFPEYPPTDLIHETWLRKCLRWLDAPLVQNRDQFFAWFHNGMFQVLVDNARKRLSQKRTAPAKQWLSPSDPELTYHLEIALRALESRKPEAGTAFRLCAVAGFTLEEAAIEMNCNVSQVRKLLSQSQHFLQRQL